MNSPSRTTIGTRRTALIIGATGQDGAYLAQLLLHKGYRVVGTSRDAGRAQIRGFDRLGIAPDVEVVSTSPHDFRSVMQTLSMVRPDEIYNLSGQTSVGLSFEQPVETIESIAIGTLNILEAMRFLNAPARLYNAGSGECFGDTNGAPASEATPFRPRSPYAVSKVCAHQLVENYRDAYGLFACTGILFNHESPLRPQRFVTSKIVHGAAEIARDGKGRLRIGNLDISRDWGWAPEYVQAMWMMLQHDQPRDFVIATGRSVSLQYFIAQAFQEFGLDWKDFVESDHSLLRPSDIRYGAADPSLAASVLGWRAGQSVDDVIRMLCDDARERVAAGSKG